MAAAALAAAALAGSASAAMPVGWLTPQQNTAYVSNLHAIKASLSAAPAADGNAQGIVGSNQTYVDVTDHVTSRGVGPFKGPAGHRAFQTFEVRACGVASVGATATRVTLHMLWHTLPSSPAAATQRVQFLFAQLRGLPTSSPRYAVLEEQMRAAQAAQRRAVETSVGPYGDEWGSAGAEPVAHVGCSS